MKYVWSKRYRRWVKPRPRVRPRMGIEVSAWERHAPLSMAKRARMLADNITRDAALLEALRNPPALERSWPDGRAIVAEIARHFTTLS